MILEEGQRRDLELLAGGHGYDRSPAARAQMVLWCDQGYSVREIAEMAGTSKPTVYHWLRRYREEGPAGLENRPFPGRPRRVSGRDRARILALTKKGPPEETGLSHWTAAETAEHLARHEGIHVSGRFVSKLWRESGIKPHRRRTFKLSPDAHFETKTRDIVGLYLDPPEGAEVLSIDNKPGMQALDRTQPARPAGDGHVATSTHDYVRKGTVDLFAAFNTKTGWVSIACSDRHRTSELLAFLDDLAEEYKDAREVHLIVDGASIHRGEDVDDWLGEHPNFILHYTPTGSSWLNQVENWFGILARKVLERGVFASVDELVEAVFRFVDHWNLDAAPFDWTATADEIIAEVEQLHRDFKCLLANNSG